MKEFVGRTKLNTLIRRGEKKKFLDEIHEFFLLMLLFDGYFLQHRTNFFHPLTLEFLLPTILKKCSISICEFSRQRFEVNTMNHQWIHKESGPNHAEKFTICTNAKWLFPSSHEMTMMMMFNELHSIYVYVYKNGHEQQFVGKKRASYEIQTDVDYVLCFTHLEFSCFIYFFLFSYVFS